MLERVYQAQLIKRIELLLPGCRIEHNDATVTQGYPDLTVYYGMKFALLEVKASEKSRSRPNQRWYIENNDANYASFIYPENEVEVLNALQRALQG